MQTTNLSVTYGDKAFVGWNFVDLPLGAALLAAAQQIDVAADLARRVVLGDSLRAVEYQLTAQEAEAFAAAGYTGDMPPSVQAWADAAELEPKAATDSIIAEADAWKTALYAIRAARLKGKQRALKATSHDAAEALADTAIAAIRDSIAGVGNAG
ncbi:hypothetical protein [Pseudomonas moorei]|uniref:Phage tail protein n=1 Tax=Pseudomonas moorei TaxID=395599 RepID=A0A1H1EGY9_9PSED|nr:hypothetical protein [Pseudomonas moorei]KAB0507772.1 hypothetical protein F7R06_06355 [Pseudomonas moorei]SDQ88065.1 hypothetical protein SAMN04490195_2198 [Pseudomonas moorei]